MIRRPPRSPLFPPPPLSRSPAADAAPDPRSPICARPTPSWGTIPPVPPAPAAGREAPMPYDLVIKNGTVIDGSGRSEEHTSELQSLAYLVCRLLLEKKKK